jgi:hypothetical protein
MQRQSAVARNVGRLRRPRRNSAEARRDDQRGVGALPSGERIAVAKQRFATLQITRRQRRVAPGDMQVTGADRFDFRDRGAQSLEQGLGPKVGERIAALEVMMSRACASPGRLASEVLDMLTPHVVPGVTTDALDKLAHDHIVNVQGGHSRAAELRAARLHALPEVDLHLDQPPGLPRHPERPAAEERRHRQHRRHRHQGRLARRHQPHVHRRRRLDRRQAPVPDHLRRHVEGHRQGQARRAPGRHRPRDPDLRRETNGFSVVREFCGHGIGPASTRSRRCCTTAGPGTLTELQCRHDVHDRADDQRRQARDPRDRRRLDHRHQGPVAVGAVGAHGARHRNRLRGDDAFGRQPPPPAFVGSA